jgi:hypothetical protein
MIVHNLNVSGTISRPAEADTPLIVDANAPLTATVALQSLETIAGRRPQVRKPNSRVQHIKLSFGHLRKRPPLRRAKTSSKELICRSSGKSLNHDA